MGYTVRLMPDAQDHDGIGALVFKGETTVNSHSLPISNVKSVCARLNKQV